MPEHERREQPPAAPTEPDRRDPLAVLRGDRPDPGAAGFGPGPWPLRLEAVADALGLPVVVVRRALLGAVVVLVALPAVAVLAWWSGRDGGEGAAAPAPVPIDRDADLPFAGATTASTLPATVFVHAAGAVARPGVYELPAGARVVDVVDAAGGATPDADPARVNLAEPVADGARVYLPRQGELAPPAVPSPGGGGGSTGGSGGSAASGSGGLVDLNTATEVELDELPGIGPATASAIVSHRATNGPFATVDELLDVRGIGPAKLEQLRPLVVAGR